jgi:hypothetical protein
MRKKLLKIVAAFVLMLGVIAFTETKIDEHTKVTAQEDKKEKCEKLYENYRVFYNECFDNALLEFLPRKIDSFGIGNLEDELARLDNLSLEFRNNPKSHIFIVIYGGKINKFGELQERPKRIVNYLSQNRKIDAKKISVVNGGFREKFEFDLWLSKSEKIFPPLSPTIESEKITFKGKMKPLSSDLGLE